VLNGSTWTASSKCGSNSCVEVHAQHGTIYVRDGKDRNGPWLAFDIGTWTAFCDGLRSGEFASGEPARR